MSEYVDTITITLSREEAERISNNLSDLALWCHGFNAALGRDDQDRSPWGTRAVTDINLKIKVALA
jgi:hypothetical protein